MADDVCDIHRGAVCLLSTIARVHLRETTPVRPWRRPPVQWSCTIENQFRQEATLALTVLPYIAAVLGVTVFALVTSAPAKANRSDAG
jgi:hypothetical protein